MKSPAGALGVLPVLGLLAAGVVAMWPLGASTADALLGTDLVGRGYEAQVRMVHAPQILPPCVVGVHPNGTADVYCGDPADVPADVRIPR